MVIWIFTAAFALLCATWSILTPPLLAPDETAHMSSTLRLTEGFSWPDPGEARMPEFLLLLGAERDLAPAERSVLSSIVEQNPGQSDRLDQMTQHPPLYYLITSTTMNTVGASSWTWDQAFLAVRLIGMLLGAPLIWLAWNTVHFVTHSRKAGIVAAAVVFVVPGLAQMLGVANNDSLAILVGSVVAALSIRILFGDRRWSVLLALGVTFGVAGLSKGTLIAFAPLVILALFFGRGRPEFLGARIWQTAWPLLVSLPFGQWWWLRNLINFGTLQPYGYLLSGQTWAPGTSPNIGTFVEEFWRIAPRTFWGWFGRVNAPLPQILVDFLTVTCLVLVVAGMLRYRKGLMRVLIITTPIAVAAILMLRVSWGAYADTTEFRGMHGRYFYPVIIPIIVLAAIALTNLVRERGTRTAFGVGAVIVSAMMSLIGPAVAFVYFYAGQDPSQWRGGLSAWVYGMSPVAPALTLGLPLAFLVLLAIGCTLAVRELTKSPRSVHI